MVLRRLLGLTVGLMVAGCSSPGVLVTRAGGGEPAKMGEAPEDGTYGLFIAGQGEPMFRVPLKKGEPIGFEFRFRQTKMDLEIKILFAVAGNESRPLDGQETHEWRRL
jgi:hypothetical protein